MAGFLPARRNHLVMVCGARDAGVGEGAAQCTNGCRNRHVESAPKGDVTSRQKRQERSGDPGDQTRRWTMAVTKLRHHYRGDEDAGRC
jgi:hypothetical protein